MTDRANARDSSAEGLLWGDLDEPRCARVSPPSRTPSPSTERR